MQYHKKEVWGHLANGKECFLYTLKNNLGAILKLSDFGASIIAFELPTTNNNSVDVIVGDKSFQYFLQEKTPYFGATIGRLAGRTDISPFQWYSETYKLEANENNVTHLHGGTHGFGKQLWNSTLKETDNSTAVEFSISSPHLESGYPGAIDVTVSIALLKDEHSIQISFLTEADRPSPINLTSHAYFNLDKYNAGANAHNDGNATPESKISSALPSANTLATIENHTLQINSNKVFEFNSRAQNTGNTIAVAGTPLDFRTPTILKDQLTQLKIGPRKGIDNIYILQDSINPKPTLQDQKLAAILSTQATKSNSSSTAIAGSKSGSTRLVLETYTTASTLVCYTGNFLSTYTTGERPYKNYEAICLETQHAPGFLHNTKLPVSMADKNKPSKSFTTYKFIITQ